MKETGARNYRGTRDCLGLEANKREQVVQKITETFLLFGFEPLETPVIELKSTLEGKYGEEGSRLTYFFSKGGEDIGLRYDHTVPLARVVAQHFNEIALPYRRYAIGPIFRAETPQKGRYRQFTQCDFDIIGVSGSVADAEVVTINYNVLKNLGFDNFEIQICDRRLLDGMAKSLGVANKEQIFAVLRSWDKIAKASREQISEELCQAGVSQDSINRFNNLTDRLVRVDNSEQDVLQTLCQILPDFPEVKKGIDALKMMESYLEKFGVPKNSYRVVPTLARGLDYYTGPIFETVVKEAGIGSITGGGRFDNLIETIGGPSIPGTGSSFGLERVISVMETLGISSKQESLIEVFVTVFDQNDPKSVEKSIEWVSKLRNWGFKTEMYMGDGKLGKQFQLADKRRAPLVLVVGPEEAASHTVTLKDMKASSGGDKTNQVKLPEGNVEKELRKFLARLS